MVAEFLWPIFVGMLGLLGFVVGREDSKKTDSNGTVMGAQHLSREQAFCSVGPL